MYLENIQLAKVNVRVPHLAGQTIHFLPGLNFIVGENGIGKSSILKALSSHPNIGISFTHKINGSTGKQLQTYFFDTEKMNPRTKSYVDSMFDVHCRFLSHGETLMPVLESIEAQITSRDDTFLILIDEPESGISPWNQIKLLKMFTKLSKRHQFIISTHSPIFTNTNQGQVIELKKKIDYFKPANSFDWHLNEKK
jgi:predicted ATPase